MVSGQYEASLGSGALFVGKDRWLRVPWTGSLPAPSALRRLCSLEMTIWEFSRCMLHFVLVLCYWVLGNKLGELYRDRTSELGVSLESMEPNPHWSRAQSSSRVGAVSVSLISWLPRLGKRWAPSKSPWLAEAKHICTLALSHSHSATSRQQLVSGPPSPHYDKVALGPNYGFFQLCVNPMQKP